MVLQTALSVFQPGPLWLLFLVNLLVRGVIDAIEYGDFSEVEWIYPFKARHIEPELIGVIAALVMRVDAAHRAEVVFGGHGIELVEGEFVRAFRDSEAIERNTCGDGTTPAAEGTIAPPGIIKTVGEPDFKDNSAAVAGPFVDGLRDDLHELEP